MATEAGFLFKTILIAIAISTLCLTSRRVSAESNPERRVLVIGIDGAKAPQIQEQALAHKAPALAQLMRDGKFASCANVLDSHCARAHSGPKSGPGFKWLTGPGWASVVTGVDNRRTEIKDNSHTELAHFAQTSRRYPTIFKRAKDLGFETAAGGVASFLSSTEKSAVQNGVLDYECGANESRSNVAFDAKSSCNLTSRLSLRGDDETRDQKLEAWMQTQVTDSKMKIVMGVLDQVDAQGHKSGFGSNSKYLEAISEADKLIGDLMKVVKTRAQVNHEEWLVIVTSDHGGHTILFRGIHDVKDFDDNSVPFIVAAYGPAPISLQALREPVSHMDTHPTVMHWLGQPSPNVDGRVQALP